MRHRFWMGEQMRGPRERYESARRRLTSTRGLLLTLWIRQLGGEVGERLTAEAGVTFRHLPNRNWKVGAGVHLGRGLIFDMQAGARLVIGDQCKLMHYTVIAGHESITIGSRVQVAESVSIRDSNHSVAGNHDMMTAPVESKAVSIGDGAWIGRGAAVLAGSTIGAGAVIGANSVVNGPVPALAIALGAPAKVHRLRS